MVLADMAGPARLGHPYGYLPMDCHGPSAIPDGRNRLAATVLDETDSEWLLMVDSDMGFDPDMMERLVACGDRYKRPVVGALCFAQKSDGISAHSGRRFRATPTIYRMAQTDDDLGFLPVFDYPPDSLIEVEATGAACVLIHRRALAKIRDEFGDVWFDLMRIPRPGGGIKEFGEDMSFCLRLAAAKIPMFVHTGVGTTHDKTGVFLDEEFYRLQQSVLSTYRAVS